MKFLSKILCFLIFFAPILGYCEANYVPAALTDLTDDVAISSPQDNQVLTYNSSTKKWDNEAANAGAESDPTVDTSAEIQAIIGAGVYQPSDADLATYAGITPSANAQTLLGETFAQMLSSIGAQTVVTEGSLNDSVILSADIKDGTVAYADMVANIPGLPHHLIVTIIDPLAVQTEDNEICIWNKTDAAITITNIEVSLDATTNEVAGDLKFADTFIALANATVVETFDTTSGVRSDNSMSGDATIPAGKCLYLSFDSAPNTAIKQMNIDITWDYD